MLAVNLGHVIEHLVGCRQLVDGNIPLRSQTGESGNTDYRRTRNTGRQRVRNALGINWSVGDLCVVDAVESVPQLIDHGGPEVVNPRPGYAACVIARDHRRIEDWYQWLRRHTRVALLAEAAEDGVFISEPMIHANIHLVGRVGGARIGDKVYRAGLIGRWK